MRRFFKTFISTATTAVIAALASLSTPPAGAEQSGTQATYTEAFRYDFRGHPKDGALSWSGLIADSRGILYGTTGEGGTKNLGAVFSLTPTQTGYAEKLLYSFRGGTDGSLPLARLTPDGTGALFGTTLSGGDGSYPGNGTVFKLTPHGSGYVESVLYRFTGGSDGFDPGGYLAIDNVGSLYGTTVDYGTAAGTVFKLTPSGSGYTKTTVHRFGNGDDGASPMSGLYADGSGALYGTTYFGGRRHKGCPDGCGTVFRLTPTAHGYRESVIFDFGIDANEDGKYPFSSVVADSAGVLYGTTSAGAIGSGTVFKLTPSAKGYVRTVLTRFESGGRLPYADLLLDGSGALYGTLVVGGTANKGAVFKLEPAGDGYVESVIYNFAGGRDGEDPHGTLIESAGILFGTTQRAGIVDVGGTVFGLRR